MKRRLIKTTKRRKLEIRPLPVVPDKKMGGFLAANIPVYCKHRWIFNYGKWWVDNTICYHCKHSVKKECKVRGGDHTELLKRFHSKTKTKKKTNNKRRILCVNQFQNISK